MYNKAWNICYGICVYIVRRIYRYALSQAPEDKYEHVANHYENVDCLLKDFRWADVYSQHVLHQHFPRLVKQTLHLILVWQYKLYFRNPTHVQSFLSVHVC